MTRSVDTLGLSKTAAFDILGNVVSATDQNGRTTTFSYDDAERLTQVSNSQNGTTRYEYDASNNTTAIVFANGTRLTQTFDAFNRLLRTTNANSQSTMFGYDRHNNITSRTDARGQTITYLYDALDRLTRKTKPTEVVQFGYDAMDNMTSVTNPNANLSFAYDRLNRLITAGTSGNAPAATLAYTYNATGDRLTMADPTGTTTYAYDALSRATSMTTPSGQQFGWVYDDRSRRTELNRSNGMTTRYAYDDGARLRSLVQEGGPGALTFAYTYDAFGNRDTMTDTSGVHNYAYDGLNRLVGATHAGGGAAESYSYDAIGNRLASQLSNAYTYDASNRLLTDDAFTYGWDAAGNMTRKTSRTNGAITNYTYDADNRLVRIDFPNGSVADYRYDGLGRRVQKMVGGVATRYVYDGADILLEYTGTTFVRRYTHGPGPDEVLGATTAAGGSLSYQADAQGTIMRALDQSGLAVASSEYDAFGRVVSRTGTAQGPYAFQGREFDEESGLYYYRARYYDPQVGRFISEDPLGVDGAANAYAFVHNNPVNLLDPLGLEVGFWEGLIPVWGSGKQAYEDFSCGRWGWGIANTALAISDVFLVKAIATGIAKGVFKSGLRMGMSRTNPAFPRGVEWVERSHWIPDRSPLPSAITDAGWNQKLMWGTDHALADPHRYRFLKKAWKADNPMPGRLTQQWNRIPDGVKGAGAAGAYGAGRAANASRKADCGCK